MNTFIDVPMCEMIYCESRAPVATFYPALDFGIPVFDKNGISQFRIEAEKGCTVCHTHLVYLRKLTDGFSVPVTPTGKTLVN